MNKYVLVINIVANDCWNQYNSTLVNKMKQFLSKAFKFLGDSQLLKAFSFLQSSQLEFKPDTSSLFSSSFLPSPFPTVSNSIPREHGWGLIEYVS